MLTKEDLILSVLRSTATKREARQYISRYTPLLDVTPSILKSNGLLNPLSISTSEPLSIDVEDNTILAPRILRISIIKIRDETSISASQLDQLGRTIAQLVKLGVSPIIVLDADTEREQYLQQTERPFSYYHWSIEDRAKAIVDSLENASSRITSRPAEDLFELTPRRLIVTSINALLQPLSRGIVPVVVPLAYDTQTGEEKLVSANSIIYSLVKTIIESKHYTEEIDDIISGQEKVTKMGITESKVEKREVASDKKEKSESSQQAQYPASIEKIIFIDPLGGLPSIERGGLGAAHVFVNLQMEYMDISSELMLSDYIPAETQKTHLDNLQTMNGILSLLPMSSAGIITTPEMAALSAKNRNPIIYNVLTDRTITSSSLPVNMKRTPVVQTTILRKGMPIKMMYSEKGIDLIKEAKVGNLDLSQLVALINDSFGKTLDVKHYLNRVNGNVAGIIIAGDYEGAAIITWEKALSKGEGAGSDSNGDESTSRVAYLDKFAVKSSSQGGSGVADMVFKAMMVRMFPKEILWRSRANNPVNKWYFERSKGTKKVSGSQWMMFWNGTHTREATDLDSYIRICSSIEPSLK